MLAVVQRTPQIREKPELTGQASRLGCRLPWAWDDLVFAIPVVAGDLEGRREIIGATLPTPTGTTVIGTGRGGNKVLKWADGNTNSLSYGHFPAYITPSTELTIWVRTAWQATNYGPGAIAAKMHTVGAVCTWVVWVDLADTGLLRFNALVDNQEFSTGQMVAAMPTGVFCNVFCRWRSGSPLTIEVLGDSGGVLIAEKASANVAGTLTWTTGPLRLNASDLEGGLGQHLEGVCQWGRRLSDTEIRALAADPWGWLSPRRETVGLGSVFPLLAGGSGGFRGVAGIS